MKHVIEDFDVGTINFKDIQARSEGSVNNKKFNQIHNPEKPVILSQADYRIGNNDKKLEKLADQVSYLSLCIQKRIDVQKKIDFELEDTTEIRGVALVATELDMMLQTAPKTKHKHPLHPLWKILAR